MRVGLVEAVLLGDAVCDEEYGGLEAVGDIAGGLRGGGDAPLEMDQGGDPRRLEGLLR